jgi:hypothetical protein
MAMNGWRDAKELSWAKVLLGLTPEHFSGEMPKRTALYKMVKGKDLSWELVEAVADICSESEAQRTRWLREARHLWDKAEREPTPLDSKADTPKQLLDVLQELTKAQAELLRLRQVRETSDQAILRANQMVMMLLMVIGQLQSQIATFKHQLGQLTQRAHEASPSVQHVQQQLTTATTHHETAQAELERAQRERDQALELSVAATAEALGVQDEVQHIREEHGLVVDDDLEAPLPPLPALTTVAGDSTDSLKDIASTLEKIKDQLDYGTDDLNVVREQLRSQPSAPRESAGGDVVAGEIVEARGADNPVRPTENLPDNYPEGKDEDSPRSGPTPLERLPSTPAEVAGQAPAQVLRRIDSLRRQGTGPSALEESFRAAVRLQTPEEATSTRVLLERLRGGAELTELWDRTWQGMRRLTSPMQPRRVGGEASLAMGSLEFVKSIVSADREEPWRFLADHLGTVMPRRLAPRFAVATMTDGSRQGL